MKIEREWYTVPALATHWQCTEEDIEHMIETGKVRAIVKVQYSGYQPLFSPEDRSELNRANRLMPDDYILSGRGCGTRIVITQAEVMMYEAKHSHQPDTPTTENIDVPQSETDQQMCNRLRKQGIANSDIAKELKRAFPTIYPSRIGRLITEIPGVHVETGTYRQRGKRLLER